MYNKELPTIPVFSDDMMIMEVKFNRTLPPYISDILSLGRLVTRSAISKYTLPPV